MLIEFSKTAKCLLLIQYTYWMVCWYIILKASSSMSKEIQIYTLDVVDDKKKNVTYFMLKKIDFTWYDIYF